jgi:hypothetical protein
VLYSVECEVCKPYVLFYLRVSHSFTQNGHAESHGLIDEVMLLHIFTHPFSELFVLGMLGMRIDVAISDSKQFLLLPIQSTFCVIPSLIG